MQAIPELENNLFENNKENGQFQSPKDISPVRSLKNKKSLSILAESDPSKTNVILIQHPTKPIKQRVISESTGLVKFSLKSPPPNPSTSNIASPTHSQLEDDQPKLRKLGLPFYIPVDSPDKHSFSAQLNSPFLSPHHKKHNKHEMMNPEEELLFMYAKKQREVLELKSRLECAEKDLKELELQLKKKGLNDDAEKSGDKYDAGVVQPSKLTTNFSNPVSEFRKKIQESTLIDTRSPIRELRQKVSMLNFTNATTTETSSNSTTTNEQASSQRGLNRQKSMLQIKQDLNELSTNLLTDGKKFQTDFLARGRNLFNNFQPFGGNVDNNSNANAERVLQKKGSFDESFLFENKLDADDDNELTYSTDESESIEDLEGGDVVPYEISNHSAEQTVEQSVEKPVEQTNLI